MKPAKSEWNHCKCDYCEKWFAVETLPGEKLPPKLFCAHCGKINTVCC